MRVFQKNAILLAALLLGVATGCFIDDDGPTITKDFPLTGFTSINLGDALELDIVVGSQFQIIAQGDAEDVNDLVLEVQNGTLISHYQPGNENRSGTKLNIEVPALELLRLHSATHTTFSDTGYRAEMQIQLEGAAVLNAKLDCELLKITVSGASEAKLDGSAELLEATVTGASKLKATPFASQECDIEVSGKSEAEVNTGKSLMGSVTGKSHLYYSGNPVLVDVDVSQDSHLTKK